MTTPNPRTVRAVQTMTRIRADIAPTWTGEQADARARYLAARRRDAARNGYRGPLTRAELAALASR